MKEGIEMSNENLQLPPIAVRANRVKDAVECREGDRIPFIPTTSNFNALGYGVSIYDVMKDFSLLKKPYHEYLKQYDPDLAFIPPFFPIDPMETAGHTGARWPGEFHGLPHNTPYQFIDKEFLEDDDWEVYLRDPSAFILNKVLPRKYSNLKGFSMINTISLCGQAIMNMGVFGLPPVKETLLNLIKTGEQVGEYFGKVADLTNSVVEAGYPPFGSAVAQAPFDDFADFMRGLITACMDIKTDPELIDEAVNRWAEVSIPAAIETAKIQHAQYIYIPLHVGVDDFMSLDDYNKHYWPTLKMLIEEIVKAEMTPIVFCEGKYYTRLETLTDVPKGKVVYMFEDIDLAKAKKILGGIACIGGGMKTQYLINGTKERVIEETKKVLDICAPGGGFIMTNTLNIDQADHALMEAWKEATIKYGTFK